MRAIGVSNTHMGEKEEGMLNFSQRLVMKMSLVLWHCFLYSLLVLLFRRGCTVQAYGDLEDEISYLYPDEEEIEICHCFSVPECIVKELSEEEDQASHCTDTYYDRIAVHCWPKFHAAIMATAENKRCLWKTIGSMYGELAVCTGLLTESMGCPVSSPTLDAFFVRIHAEYFANCSLPTNTTDLQPSTGVVIVLASLPVCLVPLSVALAVCKA